MRKETEPRSNASFQNVAEILPLVLIALGFALDWLKLAYAGLIFIAGFLMYGIFGIIVSVKREYYKGISIRFFKLITDIGIVLLSLAMLVGENTVFVLLMLILVDRLILIPQADKK
jgi:hypothetical protein